MATAIGAALFGDDATAALLAKRAKRSRRQRAKGEHAKGEHATTRRHAARERVDADGRKKKKKKKKPAGPAPAAGPGPTAPPPDCTPTCAGQACGAADGCRGTCPTGSCPGGQICQNGQCVLWCAAGFTRCGSQCVDTQTDPSHCGGCHQPCAVQDPETCGTTGQCVGGVCQRYGTETVCWHETCLDAFTSTLPSVCGGRGGPCGAPAPVDCRPGQCDFGYGSRCRYFCLEHTECSSDGWCDGNQCHFKRDNGQPCSASTPQICASGFCVDGVCCENACNAPPNAQRSCAGGACAFTCREDFGDCNNDMSDGCETPLTTVENCGQCGATCVRPNTDATCCGGTCTWICNAGWDNCDTDMANGCETRLTTTANCGQCGTTCTCPTGLNPECQLAGGTYECACTG